MTPLDEHEADDEAVENVDVEEGGTSIGEKYEEQMRQLVTQRLDIPLTSLSPMIDASQINVSPKFQRRGRWNDKQRSRLIESVIMNVPIPPVFLGEDEYGKYVVLDGRQRITALHDFVRGRYVLKDLEVWEELNGKGFEEIGEVRSYIMRRFLPAIVILNESSKEIKYDVFDRLNTSGVVLTHMELRNALYRGAFSDNLVRLSELHTFRKLWGIPENEDDRKRNILYQKMTDLELVLRFFALQRYSEFKERAKLNGFLSSIMRTKNEEYRVDSTQEAADSALFGRAIDCCWKVFGANAFRKPTDGRRSPRSAPLADAIMFAFANVEPVQLADRQIEAVKNAINDLFKKKEFLAAIGSGTNGKGAITTRLENMHNAVNQALPLASGAKVPSRSRKAGKRTK